MDCIFCRIAAGEIPAREAYRDDRIVAFHDVDPKAPVHILVIPVEHVPSLAEADAAQEALLGRLLSVCRRVAAENGLENGYRVVTNIGPEGGQSVPHLHLHVLGGRPLGWPPG